MRSQIDDLLLLVGALPLTNEVFGLSIQTSECGRLPELLCRLASVIEEMFALEPDRGEVVNRA